jgi:hypothetical protein
LALRLRHPSHIMRRSLWYAQLRVEGGGLRVEGGGLRVEG